MFHFSNKFKANNRRNYFMVALMIPILFLMLFFVRPLKAERAWILIPPSGPPADLILHNAVILTMEEGSFVQHAIAIKDNKILLVGSNRQAMRFKGTDTHVIDMQGYTVMPGIVDAHTHLFNDFTETIPDIQTAQQVAIENGITTLGNLYSTREMLESFDKDNRKLKVRTSLYIPKTTNCGVIDDDWYLEYPATRNPGESIRIGGVKLFADGGSCGDPAVSVERTPGSGLGDLFHTQEVLNQMVKDADNAGYQVAIHAIGDRGIEQALNAIEFVLEGGENTLKHRIEHSRVLTPDLIKRFGQLGVVATIFGYKRTCWLPNELPEFYQQSENAHRSLIDKNPNLHVAWHGDDPWIEPINPFIDMFSLVTRIDVISDEAPCYPPQWLADQALTVEQTLKIMTIGSAYALDRDQEVGSLREGKYADLIVLSANPLEIEPLLLKDIKVNATMINGKVLYSQLSFFEVSDIIPLP